ncbi:MAG: hypothetical protein M3O70_25620 [Actinomycetota bacterium]|nr:hypothetical protein [Actinomycetota bacterium]
MTAPNNFSSDLADAVNGLRAIQRLQAAYDDVGWRIQEPSWAKARHLLYHLVSITATLSRLVEEVEHQQEVGAAPGSEEFGTTLAERADVAGQLVFHAAQISTLAGTDLGVLLPMAWRRAAERFAPDSPFASIQV